MLKWIVRGVCSTACPCFCCTSCGFSGTSSTGNGRVSATTAFMDEQAQLAATWMPSCVIAGWITDGDFCRSSNGPSLQARMPSSFSMKGLTGKVSRLPGKKPAKRPDCCEADRPQPAIGQKPFLSSRRTPWRKAEEALITVMLEAVMDKRRDFEIYLNVIEWGDGVFGASLRQGTTTGCPHPGCLPGRQPSLLPWCPIHVITTPTAMTGPCCARPRSSSAA